MDFKYIILSGDYRSLHGVMINSSINEKGQKELWDLLEEECWESDFSKPIFPVSEREITYISICGFTE